MSEHKTMWTTRVRKATLEKYQPTDILPDQQPAYVSSWIYVAGVATIAAFVMLFASGLDLTLEGPSGWHN